MSLLKKSFRGTISLVLTTSCCANQRNRRYVEDDGRAATDRVVVLLLSLEDQIPNDHLLRLIDRHIDFSFVRERLRKHYSSTGRPSIDPEVLLRLLLIGYLYGITSERRLLEEVRMHLAYRWFSRLGFEQEIPDHSTFSKNRHGRFRESDVFRNVFEEIVHRCLEAGLVEGQNLAVDGSHLTQKRLPDLGTA
jgi:transposase